MIEQRILRDRGDHPGGRPYGILIHQTGDGPPRRAHTAGAESPIEEAAKWYQHADEISAGRGPHYVIGPDGRVIQFREPGKRAHHVLTTTEQRRMLLSGQWKDDPRAPVRGPDWADLVSSWLVRYGEHFKSPAHLYPSRDPSDDYVGIELTPCGTYIKGKWEWIWGTKPRQKSRFSVEQYIACASLCAVVAAQKAIPGPWWEAKSGRLVGHEDVNPYSRPGWDPGALRGWFHWPTLRGQIRWLSAMGAKR